MRNLLTLFALVLAFFPTKADFPSLDSFKTFNHLNVKRLSNRSPKFKNLRKIFENQTKQNSNTDDFGHHDRIKNSFGTGEYYSQLPNFWKDDGQNDASAFVSNNQSTVNPDHDLDKTSFLSKTAKRSQIEQESIELSPQTKTPREDFPQEKVILAKHVELNSDLITSTGLNDYKSAQFSIDVNLPSQDFLFNSSRTVDYNLTENSSGDVSINQTNTLIKNQTGDLSAEEFNLQLISNLELTDGGSGNFTKKIKTNSISYSDYCGVQIREKLKIKPSFQILPPARNENVYVHLKFTSPDFVFDHSGFGHHTSSFRFANHTSVHPSFFNSSQYFVLKDFPNLASPPLLIKFDFTIVKASESRSSFLCPVLLKGHDDFSAQKLERYPTVFIDESNHNMVVSLSVEGDHLMMFRSVGRLMPHTKHRIAVNIDESQVKIFLDGLLDSVHELGPVTIQQNTFDFFIGGHPAYLHSCSVAFLINELILSREIVQDPNRVHRESADVLQRALPVTLGCVDCPFNKAIGVCAIGYHLCLGVEITGEAGRLARKLGWNQLGRSRAFVEDSPSGRNSLQDGTALCCKNKN